MTDMYLYALIVVAIVIVVGAYLVFGRKLRVSGADEILVELLMILATSLDKIDQKKLAKEAGEAIIAIRVRPASAIKEFYDVVEIIRGALDAETLKMIDQKLDELYETGIIPDVN